MRSVEIAIALSHKKAYQYVVNNKLQKALIIEDDVLFDKGVKSCIKSLEHDDFFDIIFFSYIEYKRVVLSSLWNHHYIEGHKVAPIVDKPYGTQGYLITYNTACKLLNETKVISKPADHITSSYKKIGLRGFGYFPPIIQQGPFDTILNPYKE